MVLLKYAENQSPLFNGNSGMTFQRNPIGQSMKTNGKTRHYRSEFQLDKMSMFSSIARLWPHLTSIEKQNWKDWIEYLPQHTNRLETEFLGAFQNYQKRNFYKFLSEKSEFSLMTFPRLITYEIDQPSFSAIIEPNKLILKSNFQRNSGELTCLIFICGFSSNAINSTRTRDRFIISIPNVNSSIEIQAEFIEHFGKLPSKDDTLLIRTIECGTDNGQFFYPELQKISVTELPGKIIFLYNQFNLSKICPPGSHIMTFDELKLIFPPPLYETELHCEIGTDNWLNPDWGILNSDLKAIGLGIIDSTNQLYIFNKLAYSCPWLFNDSPFILFIYNDNHILQVSSDINYGISLRFVLDSSEPTSELIGNSGQIYPVTNINGVQITTIDAFEIQYNDGSMIEEFIDIPSFSTSGRQGFIRISPQE
jgi:hypothetical protein